ncbi:MAG: Holliday junction resolvase RuvX [Spirulinaceae cyanobacterium RM2_2_10]|nr:Holliday junction resolvase RuvX [Spirulinaceae cyanobacterium SM2_1_0]NJO20961.1 Holliday junction resolvase RuvX [Spirulinaceae cyanobacterium RM2_2_10]
MATVAALGLDVGLKRIGVAGCDGLGLIATGLTTIERRSFKADVLQLRYWIEARQAQRLVVGLPYTLSGELGFQAKQVQKFARRLSEALQLPVEYVDERLTSHAAKENLRARRQSFRHNKGAIDREAATIILQQWLDQRERSPARKPQEL